MDEGIMAKAKKKAKKRATVRKVVRKSAKKAVKKHAKRPAKKAAKKSGAKRRGGGLTQMSYTLSPELAAIVGAKTSTRPLIVKKMWVYIKANKLQDAKNRRMINPDKKLGEVIGNRPVDMLKLAGHINKHVKK
jgi:upstream activation factor subunit UAF30